MENNGQKRSFWDRYALFHVDHMKNENSVQNFTLSWLQRILFIVVLLFSAMGILFWGSDMWNYWRDAAVFSVWLFTHVMFCMILFFFSSVFLIRYRLNIDEDGVNCRWLFIEKHFSFSHITGAEFGRNGLGTAMVLNEGKRRWQIDSYSFGGDDFCRFIRLVREGLVKVGYRGEINGETFSPLKKTSPSRSPTLPYIMGLFGYLIGNLLLSTPHYYSKRVDNNDVGMILYYGIGCERNTEKAAHYLGRMSNAGGPTLEKDSLAVLEKYRNGQKDISAEEAYQIGCQYAGGAGMVRDLKEARNWFNKAHDLGNKHMQKRVRFMISRIAS